MANQQTKSFGKKPQTQNSNPLIPEKYQDTAYILALFLSVILFFLLLYLLVEALMHQTI